MSELERRPLAAAAAAGLKRRYLAQAAAERELATFLEGVVQALELEPARIRGFDDVTGELLLEPTAEPVDELPPADG